MKSLSKWHLNKKLVISRKLDHSTLFVSTTLDEGKLVTRWRLWYYPEKLEHVELGPCKCCEIEPVDGEASTLEEAIWAVEDKFAELSGKPRKVRPVVPVETVEPEPVEEEVVAPIEAVEPSIPVEEEVVESDKPKPPPYEIDPFDDPLYN